MDDARVTRSPQKFRWLIAPALLAVAGLLTAGFYFTRDTVKIIDGDKTIEVRTHRKTAADVVQEANIAIKPEDLILPSADSAISNNSTIVIRRAKPVRVLVDEASPISLRTQMQSANDVLATLGYKPSAYDRVTVNGQLNDSLAATGALSTTTTDIELRRAVEINIKENGKTPISFKTTATTVGEALMQNGLFVYLADIVKPSPAERLTAGMQVDIQRAKLVDVIVDGRRVRTRTHRTRISDLLADLNIIVYDQDYTVPGLDTEVSDNLQIQVIRVRREVIVKQDFIAFDERVVADSTLELDTRDTTQEGAPGIRERHTIITYENGAEVKREQVADFIAREVQPKITKYGTKVVVRSLDTPEGPVQYWRVIRAWATSYSPGTAGVPRSAPYYGIVRCGFAFRAGIVAVDPRVIPLRTNLYIPNYGKGYACDTGGGIIGKRVDLGYLDEELVLVRGWRDIYLLTPVPANINYNLP